MIKATIRDVLSAPEAFQELGKLPVPPVVALRIAKIFRQCVKLANELNVEVQKIMADTSLDDEAKSAALEAMQDREIELQDTVIPVHALGTNVQPAIMVHLHWMFV